MNLLRYLSEQNKGGTEIHVVSTKPVTDQLFAVPGVTIHRAGVWLYKMPVLKRFGLYVTFNLTSLWLLCRHRPGKVFYFETMSAWAACLYKKYINRTAALFIHFHEYTSPEEYRTGTILNRWLHWIEMKIFKLAKWVSHTNQDRKNLFINDTGSKAPLHVEVLENFPPRSWIRQNEVREREHTGIVRFVYVGALSLDTLFVKEWALFVRKFPGKYSWDIYSANCSPGVLEWIEQLHAPNIFFKGAVHYDAMPEILSKYAVGLVLYKGHIPNYIYNAPNKLFEYHACGLDTWFPDNMVGCIPYATVNTYPKITAMNFNRLDVASVEQALNRSGALYQPSSYYYEKRLPALTQLLLHDAT